MIDIQNNIAGSKSIKEPILEWKVVFHVSPLGIFIDPKEAVDAAIELGLDPRISVVPVCAAITDTEMEISLR